MIRAVTCVFVGLGCHIVMLLLLLLHYSNRKIVSNHLLLLVAKRLFGPITTNVCYLSLLLVCLFRFTLLVSAFTISGVTRSPSGWGNPCLK